MTRIVLDPATRSHFGDAKHILEVCDNSGQVLGHFLPVLSGTQAGKTEPQIGQEEIQRRLRQGGGRPLGEILADLEKMS